MLVRRTVAAVVASIALGFTLTVSAQTADPVARIFHPTPPLSAYDVATIKPYVPVTAPNGMMLTGGTTIREYIRDAYAPTFVRLAPAQVVGGPEWIDKDRYSIDGKPPADLELAMRKMRNDEKAPQQHTMQQSLLADRFRLKVHFEVREMPIYTLVPAKGGLKIQAVDAPAPRDPSSPPTPPSLDAPVPAGTMMTFVAPGGLRMVRARATTMADLTRLLSGEIGDRPIVDQTGFNGFFDINDMKWAALESATPSDSSDLPSLHSALEESLGIKLVATKGQVEVVVIDSIDHPSEN